MAPGWAVTVMLVLSTLWACGAVPPPELGHPHGVQWVWGAAGPAPAEPLPPSRRKRDDGGQKPGSTSAPGHGHAATTTPRSKETDSPGPNLLLGSAPPPAPGTNASLHRAAVVPTTAHVLDDSDSPEPDLLLSSTPQPAPSTSASLRRAFPAPTTAEPLDETDPPDPLLSSAPPAAPGTDAILHWGLPVPTTADPLHETDSPGPNLLLGSATEASTQAEPQKSVTTVPSWLMSPSEEETVAGGTDSSTAALGPTTTGYKKVNKAGDPPAATRSTPWDTKPRGTAVPWDPMRVMNECLLAILLLALVAAIFMVCTGVLGALLWRRARTAHHRLRPTEMVCISSLLPDGEMAPNGPKPAPLRRPKLLLDGGSEADGDNLTLSSFLPEHS
ncbi:P-selectin glycoprotein ligand 1 isoform 2-T2 [Alca torda]